MKNLAGYLNCDMDIERELTRCGIEIMKDQPRKGEVPSSLRGKLGSFVFTRAWYYWIVEGKVPLSAANDLYNDPVGQTDIRVDGDCSCPHPEERAKWILDGREVLSSAQEAQVQKLITIGHLSKEELKKLCVL